LTDRLFGACAAARAVRLRDSVAGKEAGDDHQAGQDGGGTDGRPGRRYETNDGGYKRIEDLPLVRPRGGKWAHHRTVLSGIFWVLNSGSQGRDMPERHGKRVTVYDRYRRWKREGPCDRILGRPHVALDEQGRIDSSVFDADGSNVPPRRAASGGRES
jgi:transposase